MEIWKSRAIRNLVRQKRPVSHPSAVALVAMVAAVPLVATVAVVASVTAGN